jgi:hypothetical protein
VNLALNIVVPKLRGISCSWRSLSFRRKTLIPRISRMVIQFVG